MDVVIPAFNAGVLLRDAVASVQSQTGAFELKQIVIVDDGSTDPVSLAVLADLASMPGVRVVLNERQKGPAGARNTGAFLGTSEWLAFLDADDIYLPDSLQARFEGAGAFPGAAVVTSDFQLHHMDTGVTEPPFFQSRERPGRIFRSAYARQRPELLPRPYVDALSTAFCHNCSILVRRDAFVAVGGYEERLRYKEDHHLWFKLAQQSDFVLVPRSVFLYRIHSRNMTIVTSAPFEFECRMLDVIRDAGVPPRLGERLRAAYVRGHWRAFRWYLMRHRFANAARSAARAIAARLRPAP